MNLWLDMMRLIMVEKHIGTNNGELHYYLLGDTLRACDRHLPRYYMEGRGQRKAKRTRRESTSLV